MTRFIDWMLGRQETSVMPAPLPVRMEAAAPPAAGSAPTEPKATRAPVIGISGSSQSSKSVIAAMSQIRSTGATPVFIGDFADRIAKSGSAQQAAATDLSRIDGLMVLGNDGDIDPVKYGAAKDPHTKVETDLSRAAYEEAAIQRALDSGMPLLGICGGMQRINVLGGGTLNQHVPDIVGDNHHSQGDSNIAPFVPVQVVKFSEGSMLSDIAGHTKSVYTPTHQALPDGVVMENSFHHQSVRDVRQDFQVNATSSDGIIEGIEPKPGSRYSHQFVMGIQWHPEFGASEVGPKIAANFTSAAKYYAAGKAAQGAYEKNVPSIPEPVLLDPALIHTDPATYQFRGGCDAHGVTESRRLKADAWDKTKPSEPLIVHQRLSGEYIVADGHHRLELAQRTNALGTGPGKVEAVVLREADGFTANDVMEFAAYKNLRKDAPEESQNAATQPAVAGGMLEKILLKRQQNMVLAR